MTHPLEVLKLLMAMPGAPRGNLVEVAARLLASQGPGILLNGINAYVLKSMLQARPFLTLTGRWWHAGLLHPS